MFAAHPLVHVNAALNATATVLLVVGLVLIKRGNVAAHKRTMLSAFAVSTAFLACYLWYHYQVGSVSFTHPGTVRYVYYAILATHILLAVTVPPLAIATIYLGLRATGRGALADQEKSQGATGSASAFVQEKETVPFSAYRRKHRRLAHWTYPIWLYVSITGVVVYLMLYHLWPPVGP